MNFDELTLRNIQKSLDPETFEKAMKRAGLVYVQKPVNRHGKTFTQGFWVSADEAKKLNEKHGDREMKTSKDMHTDRKGRYSRKRAERHDKIVNEVVKQSARAKPGEKPVAILMGGGSASGKSTMRKGVIDGHLAKRGIKAGTVDSDEIKEKIPEYKSLKKTHPNDAARLVHEESSDVGSKMLDKLIEDKRHFVYDGTMRSTKKYQKLVDKLKKAGYEIHAYVADVPIEEAIKRSDARAEKTGRKVPHEIIVASHKGVPSTIESIKDKIDSYKVFDNTDKLKLIASNEHVDPEKYAKFLEKGGMLYRATAEKTKGGHE